MVIEIIGGIFLLFLVLVLFFGLIRLAYIASLKSEYQKEIDEDNREIIRTWERESHDQKKLVIERTIKPPGLFSPTITFKQTITKKGRRNE